MTMTMIFIVVEYRQIGGPVMLLKAVFPQTPYIRQIDDANLQFVQKPIFAEGKLPKSGYVVSAEISGK